MAVSDSLIEGKEHDKTDEGETSEVENQENEMISRIRLGDREIVLVGTAHVSRESVEDVRRIVEEEQPERLCIEIDEGRYNSLKNSGNWRNLNVHQVLKEGKGFLMLANLVLTSFQRKLGSELDISPGEEMKAAVEVAEEKEIPFTFSDRQIQTTLKRAWSKSSFWGKNKLLAALIGSIFSKEKMSSEDIESIKKKNAIENMMEELAEYIPHVKTVLIDERDQYLATSIFNTTEKKVVAVVGAGHMGGIERWLLDLEKGSKKADVSEINTIPPKGNIARILPWVIPAVILGLIGAGFFRSGLQLSLQMFGQWILINGTLSALGALIALAHPLTIILSFLAAPLTSMNPTIGVGIVAGLIEAWVRKPRVQDFENIQQDILSLRGFFRNRITHVFIVFFLSSLGSAIGTFIGIPFLSSLLT